MVEIRKNDQKGSAGKNGARLAKTSISNDVDEDLLAHDGLFREWMEGIRPQDSIEPTRGLQNKGYHQC